MAGTVEYPRELLAKNLRLMKIGQDLLKVGKSGKVAYRKMRLSPDNEYIMWESHKKAPSQTRIKLSSVTQVKYGQLTKKFRECSRSDLRYFSFSLIYGNEDTDTLDLICRDDKEFGVWAETIHQLVTKGWHRAEHDPELWKMVGTDVPVAENEMKIHRRHKTLTADAIAESNDAYAFGWSEWGQTGTEDDTTNSVMSPEVCKSLLGKGVVQVASGWSHTTILLESGKILVCGNRLGTAMKEDYFVPQPLHYITEKMNVIGVACGSFHTVAWTEQGQVFSWGSNHRGQLGLGHLKDVTEPAKVAELSSTLIVSMDAGEESTVALGSDGSVYTWGNGDHGQLGHGDTEDRIKPEQIQFLKGSEILRVAAGSNHMFACTERQIWSWGWNGRGQLGLGDEADHWKPQKVDALQTSKILDIAAGAAHTIALVYVAKPFAQSIVYAWGSNCKGQLGISEVKNYSNHPLAVELAEEVVKIACGDMHSVVLTSKGNVFVSGDNTYGQLGLGRHFNTDQQDAVSQFTRVSAFDEKQARSVCCGGAHTIVLTQRAWIRDEDVTDCMSCKTTFGFTTRRHHCRNCLGIFCNACSGKRICILRLGLEPVRVCDTCYASNTH